MRACSPTVARGVCGCVLQLNALFEASQNRVRTPQLVAENGGRAVPTSIRAGRTYVAWQAKPSVKRRPISGNRSASGFDSKPIGSNGRDVLDGASANWENKRG